MKPQHRSIGILLVTAFSMTTPVMGQSSEGWQQNLPPLVNMPSSAEALRTYSQALLEESRLDDDIRDIALRIVNYEMAQNQRQAIETDLLNQLQQLPETSPASLRQLIEAKLQLNRAAALLEAKYFLPSLEDKLDNNPMVSRNDGMKLAPIAVSASSFLTWYLLSKAVAAHRQMRAFDQLKAFESATPLDWQAALTKFNATQSKAQQRALDKFMAEVANYQAQTQQGLFGLNSILAANGRALQTFRRQLVLLQNHLAQDPGVLFNIGRLEPAHFYHSYFGRAFKDAPTEFRTVTQLMSMEQHADQIVALADQRDQAGLQTLLEKLIQQCDAEMEKNVQSGQRLASYLELQPQLITDRSSLNVVKLMSGESLYNETGSVLRQVTKSTPYIHTPSFEMKAIDQLTYSIEQYAGDSHLARLGGRLRSEIASGIFSHAVSASIAGLSTVLMGCLVIRHINSKQLSEEELAQANEKFAQLQTAYADLLVLDKGASTDDLLKLIDRLFMQVATLKDELLSENQVAIDYPIVHLQIARPSRY